MEMNSGELVAIANTLSEFVLCFTQADLFSYVYAEEEYKALLRTIQDDPRFVSTQETSGAKFFITKRALHHWFVNLNIRLAKGYTNRLSTQQLTRLMSALRSNGQWDTPPAEYIELGKRFSLISCSLKQGEYVFPLAHVISLILAGKTSFVLADKIEATKDALDSLATEIEPVSLSNESVLNSLEEALSILSPRQRYVIERREGLLGGNIMTLEQIGQSLELTRERVRQLEAKAWKSIYHHKYCSKFITALLFDIMHHNGSFLIDLTPQNRARIFILKCNSIPAYEFPHADIAIIGATKNDIRLPEDPWKFVTEPSVLASYLQCNDSLPLAPEDMQILAEKLALFQYKKLTKAQRVYLTLKHIERPAHFTEVTEVYNVLFPDESSNEHSIHAVLSHEKHGVVWIGIRGTFALKEWGYEHPPVKLFDAVSDIIQRKYAKTGKPVPFTVIAAEISRYRRVLKPASIVIAAYCNPKLENVYRDYFIPRYDSQEESQITAEKLDRILQEFERKFGEQEIPSE
jgi:hypothetical protein